MAEMPSLSSAPLVLKNVTVTPNVFELKKCYRFCTSPTNCTNFHRSIIFGDLAELKRLSAAGDYGRFSSQRSSHDFSLGNYSVSVLNGNQEEAKRIVVFHHENLDPTLLATALLDGKDKIEEVSAVEKCANLFGKMDLTSSSRPSLNSFSYKKSGSKHRNGNDDNRAQTTSLKLVWKAEANRNLLRDVKNTDLWMPDLDGFFYFLNAAAWFECDTFRDSCDSLSDNGRVVISPLTGGIYQLQAANETIGIAINPWDVLGDAEISTVLIEDPLDNCLAVVLQRFVEQDSGDFAKLIFPKDSFLYENVYRSFYKFGEEIENPYYGYKEDSEFARLPDTAFVKILLYLPWRQRLQCRRVNKQWRAVANSATAIDTKVIHVSNKQYKGMRAEHLNFVLPIVSNHLKEFIWSNSWLMDDIFNFEGIGQVQLFPKLRKIHIDEQTPDFDGFFSMLSKCPNLKELSAPIPRRPSSNSSTPGPYVKVEKLCIPDSGSLTDPWLIQITDCFPNLTSLHICGYEFLSSSCISAVAEKYGQTLTRLEILAESHYEGRFSEPAAAASVIGAVTGFGICPYLEYLLLVGTGFISYPCMAAIGTGCAKLTTLDIYGSCTVTNEGLVALASLPNLTQLDMSNVGRAGDLSFGIAQLAKAGHLEQLLVKDAPYPSAACLKTCVRYCRQLKLVDISGSTADLAVDDATEIIQLYGTWGLNSRLIFRSGKITWRKQEVRTAQDEITATFNRRFVTVVPHYPMHSKWAPEDDADPAGYEGMSISGSEYMGEEYGYGAIDMDIDDYAYGYDSDYDHDYFGHDYVDYSDSSS